MNIILFNYLMLEYGGGFAHYLMDIADGLTRRHADVDIQIVALDAEMARWVQGIYSLYFGTRFPPPRASRESISRRIGRARYRTVSTIKELRALMRSADLIYSKNDIMELTILRLLIGYQGMPPVIVGFHTPVFYERTSSIHTHMHNMMYGSWAYDYVLAPAAGLHVLNEFDKNLFTRRMPNKKVSLIHNPFDVRSFSRAVKTHRVHNTSGIQRILWVGRLTKEKGCDDLIDIIQKVIPGAPDLQWHIVGEGPMRPLVDALCMKLPVVHYDPYIPASRMPEVYASADLVLMTSRCECFPYVLLEAASAGLPAIAYRIHGCTDIIRDGVTGYLVSTLAECASRITALAAHNSFMSSDIRDMICDNFDYESAYSQLYRLMKDTYGGSLR